MCRSCTTSYTNCGHVVRIPDLCHTAQWRRPVYACWGWDDPLREFFQAKSGDCPRCQHQTVLRLSQTSWRSFVNENARGDVPILNRRGSLQQRYVPTPPPAYMRGYEYGSGYVYGENDTREARGNPDPSSHEIRRRVSEWANRVPPGAPPASHASTERELYRSHEHDRAPAVSTSRRHSSAGIESHAPRHHRRQSDIYDPRRTDAGHVSRAELDSDQRTRCTRASDGERRTSQSTGHLHGAPSVAGSSAVHKYDDSVVEVTETHVRADGAEVTRTTRYRIEQQSTCQRTPAWQIIKAEERGKHTPVPHAEEEAYTEEVEAWRISEARSHLFHHADFDEWLV